MDVVGVTVMSRATLVRLSSAHEGESGLEADKTQVGSSQPARRALKTVNATVPVSNLTDIQNREIESMLQI